MSALSWHSYISQALSYGEEPKAFLKSDQLSWSHCTINVNRDCFTYERRYLWTPTNDKLDLNQIVPKLVRRIWMFRFKNCIIAELLYQGRCNDQLQTFRTVSEKEIYSFNMMKEVLISLLVLVSRIQQVTKLPTTTPRMSKTDTSSIDSHR